MKRQLTTFSCFIFPSIVLRPFLRMLGHKIGKGVKVGFSILNIKEINLGDGASIGHLNLILNSSIKMSSNSTVGYLNILKGPFDVVLEKRASIGNKNYITRGKIGITYGNSVLKLGELSRITVGHHLDLTKSITFGDFSILAGLKSQMWTHGYYHAEAGKDRIRIDGNINIGNNVYIGSACIFNPGVSVRNAINIGAGSVISKDLVKKGMYVGQALRYIENNFEEVKAKLKKVEEELVDNVYTKN